MTGPITGGHELYQIDGLADDRPLRPRTRPCGRGPRRDQADAVNLRWAVAAMRCAIAGLRPKLRSTTGPRSRSNAANRIEVTRVSGWTDDGCRLDVRVTPEGCPASNYAFDVTPTQLVTALGIGPGLARRIAQPFPKAAQARLRVIAAPETRPQP